MYQVDWIGQKNQIDAGKSPFVSLRYSENAFSGDFGSVAEFYCPLEQLRLQE